MYRHNICQWRTTEIWNKERATRFARSDPCRLVRPVREIPRLEPQMRAPRPLPPCVAGESDSHCLQETGRFCGALEIIRAVVTKIRFPATIGCDHPRPGMGTFQTTRDCSDHCWGTLASGITPSPRGPRNCDQSSAAESVGRPASRRTPSSRNPSEQKPK